MILLDHPLFPYVGPHPNVSCFVVQVRRRSQACGGCKEENRRCSPVCTLPNPVKPIHHRIHWNCKIEIPISKVLLLWLILCSMKMYEAFGISLCLKKILLNQYVSSSVFANVLPLHDTAMHEAFQNTTHLVRKGTNSPYRGSAFLFPKCAVRECDSESSRRPTHR